MSGAALLRFPIKKNLRDVDSPGAPPSDIIDRDHSRQLLGMARHVIENAKALIEFVTENRWMARQLGIETLIVELSGIDASGKLERVRDALEETVATGSETRITLEGLSYLKRAEKIVAEASRAIARGESSPDRSPDLGNSTGPTDRSGPVDTFSILGLVSVIAVTMLVILFAMNKK